MKQDLPIELKLWLFQCHAMGAANEPVSQALNSMGFEANLYSPEKMQQLFGPVALDAALLVSADMKRLEWQMGVFQQNLNLLTDEQVVPKVSDISSDDFLKNHYALGMPVVIKDWVNQWPAFKLWKDDQYLLDNWGDIEVEYTQTYIENHTTFKNHVRKLFKDYHAELKKLDYANDHYITSYNNPSNQVFLEKLLEDINPLLPFLDAELLDMYHFMPWIGPHGTHTGLHIDAANGLLCQVKGKKWVKLAAPCEMANFYLDNDFFSKVNLFNPNFDQYPKANNAKIYDVELNAGEALFIPATWWHQVLSLEESYSVTLSNFIYPNRYAPISAVFPELKHDCINSMPLTSQEKLSS